MIHYDNAIIKFRKKLKYQTLPVLSWEFYSDALNEYKEFTEQKTLLSQLALNNAWRTEPETITQRLRQNKNVVLITDTELNIVYATNNVLDMSQYSPKEVIGKKPKMFQGKETSNKSLQIIRNGIINQKAFETVVVNYKKDGTTYKCHIVGEPIFDNYGKLVNFIAFEKEVA